MTLSDQDKQRIREEEKERLKIREQLQSKQKRKIPKWASIGCGGLLLLIIIIVIIAIASGGNKNTSKDITLNAAVRFTGTQFIIQNNDSFEWDNVQLELNSPGIFSNGYIYTESVIPANTQDIIGAMQFAKSDGTRFDPFATKPMQMNISCDVDSNRGYYTGTWK